MQHDRQCQYAAVSSGMCVFGSIKIVSIIIGLGNSRQFPVVSRKVSQNLESFHSKVSGKLSENLEIQKERN